MATATLEIVLAKIKRNRAVAVRIIELQTTAPERRELMQREIKALDKLEAGLRKKHVQ